MLTIIYYMPLICRDAYDMLRLRDYFVCLRCYRRDVSLIFPMPPITITAYIDITLFSSLFADVAILRHFAIFFAAIDDYCRLIFSYYFAAFATCFS